MANTTVNTTINSTEIGNMPHAHAHRLGIAPNSKPRSAANRAGLFQVSVGATVLLRLGAFRTWILPREALRFNPDESTIE